MQSFISIFFFNIIIFLFFYIILIFNFFLFLLDSTLNKSLCEILYIDFDFALSQRLLLMFYFYFLRLIL